MEPSIASLKALKPEKWKNFRKLLDEHFDMTKIPDEVPVLQRVIIDKLFQAKSWAEVSVFFSAYHNEINEILDAPEDQFMKEMIKLTGSAALVKELRAKKYDENSSVFDRICQYLTYFCDPWLM